MPAARHCCSRAENDAGGSGLPHPIVVAVGHRRNEAAAVGSAILQQRLEGRGLGIVGLGRRIGRCQHVGAIVVDECGEHRRQQRIGPGILANVERRCDLDFLAFDLGRGERHLEILVDRRIEQHRGPLEHRAGVEGLRRRHRHHFGDAALLVAAHNAILVGRLTGVYALAAQRDGADARGEHAGAGDRAGRDA